MMKYLMLCCLSMALFITGCAADLSSGKKFTAIENPPADKTAVYLLRDESYMATKVPYAAVKYAKSDGKGEPAAPYQTSAIVGKDMFVPVLMDPGTYVFKTAFSSEITLKPGTVTCLDVGGKYRVVTIFNVTELDLADCKKVLEDKFEGVQLAEARKRIGSKVDGD